MTNQRQVVDDSSGGQASILTLLTIDHLTIHNISYFIFNNIDKILNIDQHY